MFGRKIVILVYFNGLLWYKLDVVVNQQTDGQVSMSINYKKKKTYNYKCERKQAVIS